MNTINTDLEHLINEEMLSAEGTFSCLIEISKKGQVFYNCYNDLLGETWRLDNLIKILKSCLSKLNHYFPLSRSVCFIISLRDEGLAIDFGIPQLVWSLPIDPNDHYPNSILIPNPYALTLLTDQAWGHLTDLKHEQTQKPEIHGIALFAGKSTGRRGGSRHLLYQESKNFLSVLKMCFNKVGDHWSPEEEVSEGMGLKSQKNYQYLVSVDGNSSDWDRPMWFLNSNSIPIFYRKRFLNWFDTKLFESDSVLKVESLEEMQREIHNLNHRPEKKMEMIENGKLFAKTFFTAESIAAEMCKILKALLRNKQVVAV
jgi:hypothetical protein